MKITWFNSHNQYLVFIHSPIDISTKEFRYTSRKWKKKCQLQHKILWHIMVSINDQIVVTNLKKKKKKKKTIYKGKHVACGQFFFITDWMTDWLNETKWINNYWMNEQTPNTRYKKRTKVFPWIFCFVLGLCLNNIFQSKTKKHKNIDM